MALRPVNGRAVWARTPRQRDAHPQRPLAARLHQAPRRLAQDGGVPLQEVGALPPTARAGRCPHGRSPRGRRSTRSRRQSGSPHASVARSSMTARPPFMSDAPTPHSDVAVEPGHLRCRWAATVSRWPASTRRRARPELGAGDDVVADPVTSSQGQRVECRLHQVGQRPLVPARARGRPSGPGVAARRSPIGSGAGAVVPQDLVQLRLVVALPLAQPLDDEHARHEELATRVLAPPAGPDGDAPRRHDAA